jgi:diguanylate cyclase (GGDEF)-like protein
MAVCWARWRARVVAYRDAWRDLDSEQLAARLGALLFVAGGGFALVFHLLPDEFAAPAFSLPIALLAIVLGALAWRAPWDRWPVDAQLAYPLVGFALTAAAAHGQPQTGVATVVTAFTLLFMVTGFSQRPGRCTLLAPMAAIAMLAALPEPMSGAAAAETLVEVAVTVVCGEAVALVLRRQRRAERSMRALLDGVRTLAWLDDPELAVRSVATLAVDLLGADAAAVLLRDTSRSSRLVTRATAGHPALAATVPHTLRARSGVVARALDDGGIVVAGSASGPSTAVLPIATRRGTLGCILVLWNRPHARFARATRDAAQMLAQEAGRTIVRIRRQDQLAVDATTDPLTALANRRTFTTVLGRLALGDAVVVIDLDHFKAVNDTLGHAAGDDVLRSLAVCLRDVGRQGDTVARFGGEEFALVLPDAGEHGARVLLARLRRAWRRGDPVTTFSAGVAVHRGTRTPAETLQRADAALYAAKHAGRDRDAFDGDDREAIVDLTADTQMAGIPSL